VTEFRDLVAKTPPAAPLGRVVIVGRPNVGKSTLFNRLVGSRRAIVHDLPGVTRDQIWAEAHWCGRFFALCDTGGLHTDPAAGGIEEAVRDQAWRAAAAADVVILLVDGRQGLLPADAEIARELRQAGVQHLLLAVNKLDTGRDAVAAADFAVLGIDTTLAVSAEHGAGLPELLDAVIERLPASAAEGEEKGARPLGVTLVGRPNVGKSTLFNALVGSDRAIVSEVPGTTRDTVDVVVERDGLKLRFVDTAGIRRPGRTARGPEVLSVVMARRSIRRADVVVLVLDSTAAVAHQDAAVAGLSDQAGRALVIAASKWDLVGDPEPRRLSLEAEVADGLKFLAYAPLVTVSGVSGRGLGQLLKAIGRVDRAWRRQVPTAELNRFVETQLAGLTLPAPGASAGRILYATQVGVRPPTFAFFVNRRVKPHFSTVRRVTNLLRRTFALDGTPVRVHFRHRSRR
jgi:GTP-binding protein